MLLLTGNHFNEWAGFDCEWELYPSKQAQEDWITAYVSGLKEWRGREIPPSEVSGLMKEVELLQLASHLYWALWGVLQVRQARSPRCLLSGANGRDCSV